MSSRGQIVLPAELRRQDHIEPGEEFDVERVGTGKYRLVRRPRARKRGLVRLLLACPVKGWFKPADRRETTADLRVPRPG